MEAIGLSLHSYWQAELGSESGDSDSEPTPDHCTALPRSTVALITAGRQPQHRSPAQEGTVASWTSLSGFRLALSGVSHTFTFPS